MKITSVSNRDSKLIQQLISIWESSVRATHHFLTEDAIQIFKESLPTILNDISQLIIVQSNQEKPLAFMGIDQTEIEMLFVDDTARGQGIGKMLINYATEELNATTLNVNEQNPQAVGFYQHMGFETYRRTETDGFGNPYPILYMQIKKANLEHNSEQI